MDRVDKLMRQAVADKVFPGAVLLISRSNSILYSRAYGAADESGRHPVRADTIFDLASLTKPLATTLAVMKLVTEGVLDINDTVSSVLPSFQDTGKGEITIRNLLCHNSGLPDYHPFYLALIRFPLAQRTALLRDRLLNIPVNGPPGVETVYSDLGFMILRWVIESLTGEPLDLLLAEEVYRPLGISDLFYIERKTPFPLRQYAATEDCPWRERVLRGEVHDENAWVVGGVEGHAGLFGTAKAVNRLLWSMLTVYYSGRSASFLHQDLVQRFFSRQPDSPRALGFDTPSETGSSSGGHFSPNSIGHLGFTGTSFWVDLDHALSVVLLTNRVHPSRDDIRIRSFRPVLHDAVFDAAV